MTTDKLMTYDEIIVELEKTSMGLAPDFNPVNGLLASYVSGVMQALYNVLHNPEAVQHYLDHRNDDGGLYNPPCDIWHEGYCGIMSNYIKFRT